MAEPVSTNNIRFFYQQVKFYFKNRTRVKLYLLHLFKSEKINLEALNYIFCTDRFLLEMNRQYLQHDFYTDVITFTLSSPENPINGEVYISIDRVQYNAIKYKSSFIAELHRVIIHGALHLCGYQDKLPDEIQEMRKLEQFHLSELEKFCVNL